MPLYVSVLNEPVCRALFCIFLAIDPNCERASACVRPSLVSVKPSILFRSYIPRCFQSADLRVCVSACLARGDISNAVPQSVCATLIFTLRLSSPPSVIVFMSPSSLNAVGDSTGAKQPAGRR